jgi:hypothetical protein
MRSLREEAIAIQRRGRAFLTFFVVAVWVLPQVIFWTEAWDKRNPEVTMAFLAAGLFAFVAAALPEGYYRPRGFEASGLLYERIGVRLFRHFVMNGDDMNTEIRRIYPTYRVIVGQREMRRLEEQTRVNERSHVFAFWAGLPAFVYAVLLGWTGFAIFLGVATALANVYPILLQRYTRARILGIRRRHALWGGQSWPQPPFRRPSRRLRKATE